MAAPPPSRDEIESRVIQVIARTRQLDPEKVTACSTFDELDIDSFEAINLLFEIENEFDVHVPDEEAQKLRSVGEVVAGVEKLLSEKAAPPGG